MKKFLFGAVAAFMAIVAIAADSTPAQPSINWGRVTSKYRLVDSVKQIITVQYIGGWDCKVKLFEKSRVNGKVVWTETLSCDGNVGTNGIDKVREGDRRTPTGDYEITVAYGIKNNPGTSLPYIDVVETTYCCAEPIAYNRIIDVREVKHDCKGEHMIEYTPEYNYGFFYDYNKECVLGKGSALFFHCTGPKPSTAGCVAVSEPNMVAILRALEPGARIIIDHMPKP